MNNLSILKHSRVLKNRDQKCVNEILKLVTELIGISIVFSGLFELFLGPGIR